MLKIKSLKKRNKILSVFKSSKDLDPFFFELLMDSIRDSNKTLIAKKNPQSLFIIYSNIFATKKLNRPLAKEQTLDRKFNKVTKNMNLIYSVMEQRSIRKLESNDQQVSFQLKKNLFYNLYLNRYNKLISSQVISSLKIIQSWDKI